MRIRLVIICLIASSHFLWAQPPSDIRVDMPHYVAIGPSCYTLTAPSGYYLMVEGGILTERLRVANRNGTNWADHVFDPSYPLMSLRMLERYIQAHRHLPGVPTAETVASQGVELVQMQATLLAKVEELTLHVIRQDKQIASLRRKLRTKPNSSHSLH